MNCSEHCLTCNIETENIEGTLDSLLYHSKVNVLYSFKAIGSSISNLEVAHEWLGIAFILDRLSRFDKNISYVREGNITFYLTIIPDDWELFIKELKAISEWNDYGTFSELDLAFADFVESVNSYKAETPDFVENYFANYVSRGIHEEASQYEDPNAFLEATYRIHPEWRFGLWQCHKQGISDGEVLYSQFCWVIDNNKKTNLFKAIYGYEPAFEKCIEKNDLFFTQRASCKLSAIKNINEALCWIASLGEDISSGKYWLSNDGEILLIDYGMYSIVYFDFAPVSSEEIQQLYQIEKKTVSTLAKLARVRGAIAYKWENLNDDLFQELCLKLLVRISRFYNARIEPTGKARSRDGGRDFIAVTRDIPSCPSGKYVIQCKYKENGESLTRSRMGDVGTTILQYGADGYIIMTNGIMDTTLIDSLDGFRNNPKINIDVNYQYTRPQLEHLLDLNPDIADYFKLV